MNTISHFPWSNRLVSFIFDKMPNTQVWITIVYLPYFQEKLVLHKKTLWLLQPVTSAYYVLGVLQPVSVPHIEMPQERTQWISQPLCSMKLVSRWAWQPVHKGTSSSCLCGGDLQSRKQNTTQNIHQCEWARYFFHMQMQIEWLWYEKLKN